MPQEYEYAFFNFKKNDIISKIKEMNGKHKGTYLFRVQVFIHPLEAPGTYIRVRDEGFRTTMTYKLKDPKSKFENEEEILINDFDVAVNILLGVGCKKKYYYEKIREIWDVKNTEVVFDSNPGIDDRLEVESKTKTELNKMVKYFDLTLEGRAERYLDLFGIVIPKTMDLTFQNVKKGLIKFVKKDKEKFIKLVDDQLNKYKKLMKQNK
jgi:predicted adenylyl cyclase CyaB